MDISIHSITILEECHVSPSPNLILTPSNNIPLTFYDIPWFNCPPVQRIFFYELPHSTLHFTNTVIPQLKHALSLALKHFYPIAGTVVFPSRPDEPYILCKDGDSIPLIIAESNADFSHLVQHYPRDATEFHPLVPTLMNKTDALRDTNQEQAKLLQPLVAIQVTIFPNSGICIGITFQHVVADGRAINNFIKSWASIFKSKNDNLPLSFQPLLDRAKTIKDPNGYLQMVWNQWCDSKINWDSKASSSDDEISRATFVLSRAQIDKLKHKVLSHFNTMQEQPPVPHVSTFVATCAFIWVCYIKTQNIMNNEAYAEANFICYFSFLADASERTHVPKTYFGNCLTPCCCSVWKSELLGENGLFEAAKSFMKEVKELGDGNFKNPVTWMFEGAKLNNTGHMITVAASPKLNVYETDFGWGKPRKSEVVHIDRSGPISLSESRDEKGGVEIGLALSKSALNTFISFLDLGLKILSSE